MRSPKAMQWEGRLKGIFDTIDAELESEYGKAYRLHPSRPKRDATSNPEADGLFNIGASFSAGFGSKTGPGYIVEIRFSTLERVPLKIREEIKQYVFQSLEKKLPQVFPNNELKVSKENGIIRIYGDLSLDDGNCDFCGYR